MSNSGIPIPQTTALLVIDVQEKLMPVVQNPDFVKQQVNRLIQGASVLSLPIIVTEQYPQGLGATCSDIVIPDKDAVIQKMCFSCMQSEDVIKRIKNQKITDIIIAGVESHICVLKTALEAIDAGYRVHIVADAVSSRTNINKELAIERMRQSGAYIVSTEMILFMLIQEAGTDTFRSISKLIK
ncbi:MAG: hydrolase [Candidatus Competibacteraceae bacterium]|nr:hydrolase [Candidatus Competibacteraceae bacterium]